MKRNNTVAGVFEPFPLTKALKSQDHEQMAFTQVRATEGLHLADTDLRQHDGGHAA